MKILFSESSPDYAGYVFPYAIWGFLEVSETPSDALAQGFLPSLPDLSRYYLCRQVRVQLAKFHPNSENRRVLRKGEGIQGAIRPLRDFEWTPSRRELCLSYASRRWTSSPSPERIDRLFHSALTTHVAIFEDRLGQEIGLVSLFNHDRTWFYSNAFFQVDHPFASLGAFLMTETVRQLAEDRQGFLHLGTCYSRSALYKTQFPGTEFFNGTRWSGDLEELKHLITRQEKETPGHLLEDPAYLDRWVPEGIANLADNRGFQVNRTDEP